MTDEQMNQRIAEACGWKWVKNYQWTDSNGLNAFAWDIPNYCNCLNFMHEAEKVLDKLTEWQGEEHHWHASETYIAILSKILRRHTGMKSWDDFELATTTARQRAEAFLRTLGKWEEVQGE